MKERPILFKGELVRAILDGRKTQTRRLVRDAGGVCSDCLSRGVPHNALDLIENGEPNIAGAIFGTTPYLKTPACEHHGVAGTRNRCPFGATDDRLWVRETWQYADWTDDGYPWIRYAADDARLLHEHIPDDWKERVADAWAELSAPDNFTIDGRAADRQWRPSIFLPRWAARLTLEVTEARVERLHDITEDDARAEGVDAFDGMLDEAAICAHAKAMGTTPCENRPWFATAWDMINGKRAPWASNPWVWAITFRRVL
jgi:hypothetical protein